MPTKKSRNRPPQTPGASPGRRLNMMVPQESYQQINDLATAFHMTRTAVVTLCVARFHHDEQSLLKSNGAKKKRRTKKDGGNHSRV